MLEVKRKPASHSHGAAAPAAVHVSKNDTSVGGNGDRPNASQQLRTLSTTPTKELNFQTKLPVIVGEVNIKGTLSVDGLLSGQIGSNSGMNLKQRASASFVSQPELAGEISFKDMVRVNGHIAGTIQSKNGTLIVDISATVEANVDVAVAVIGGTVMGDIVARERVELGPASKIHGNIWTRSIVIKDGAIFEGVCRMLEDQQKAS